MSDNGQVRISDFSDRELLAMILDLDASGEVNSHELAVRIYGWSEIAREDAKKVSHGVRCCGARLAWMKRYGLVERGEKKGEWTISHMGRQLTERQLPADVRVTISRTPDERSLSLANIVGERMVAAGTVAGTAMRRELQFQITRRKRAT